MAPAGAAACRPIPPRSRPFRRRCPRSRHHCCHRRRPPPVPPPPAPPDPRQRRRRPRRRWVSGRVGRATSAGRPGRAAGSGRPGRGRRGRRADARAALAAGTALGLVGEDAVVTGAAAVRRAAPEKRSIGTAISSPAHADRERQEQRRSAPAVRERTAWRAVPGPRGGLRRSRRSGCRDGIRRRDPGPERGGGAGPDSSVGRVERCEAGAVSGRCRLPIERATHAETRTSRIPPRRVAGADAAGPATRPARDAGPPRRGRPAAARRPRRSRRPAAGRRRRCGRAGRASTVVYDQPPWSSTDARAEDDVVRRRARAPPAPRAAHRRSAGSPSCSAPPGRAPGAAVVRPPGAVLQQHLGPPVARPGAAAARPRRPDPSAGGPGRRSSSRRSRHAPRPVNLLGRPDGDSGMGSRQASALLTAASRALGCEGPHPRRPPEVPA